MVAPAPRPPTVLKHEDLADHWKKERKVAARREQAEAEAKSVGDGSMIVPVDSHGTMVDAQRK